MAKFTLFDDAPVTTAEHASKTRYEAPSAKSGQSTGAPWLIDYLNATTPPDDRVICYRQLVGETWVWGRNCPPESDGYVSVFAAGVADAGSARA